MNMHHTIHPNSNVERLYLPQKIGGHGLLQIHEAVEELKINLNDYISTRKITESSENGEYFENNRNKGSV